MIGNVSPVQVNASGSGTNTMQLYAHQKKLLYENPERCLIAHGTGTGKSITALELARQNNVSTLIICPKALKPMWLRYNATYGNPHTILTKEEFKREAKTLPYYKAIIVDEAHHFSGNTSQLGKVLLNYIKQSVPRYVWLLTATPYRSTPWNVYQLALYLGKYISYMGFKHEYFYDVRMGAHVVPVARPDKEESIAELVRSLGSVVSLDDCADVPEQTFDTEYLDLTKEQEKGILKIDDQAFISRFTKTHSIENGILNGDGYTQDQEFDCNKTERILELCAENKKIAVVCRYNAQIEYYQGILKAAGFKVLIINGAVKDRDAVVREAEGSTECVVLIQAQCSEGYELPSIGVCVFASLSFSYLDYVQCLGRFLRINKLKKNHYIHLVIKGGYDEDIYDCIMNKQDFDLAIYKKGKYGIH